jgi:autotransporter passenger strand-loop-strand repeat protein
MTTIFISSGNVSSGITVTNGNTLEVESGGTASATTVEAGGIEQIDVGGVANGTILSQGAAASVYGTDSAAQIGGTEDVFSGGLAFGDTVLGGGTLNVSGFASGTIISHEGVAEIRGSDAAAQIHGILDVFSGGFASDDTVRDGGVMGVASSGSATGTAVKDGGLLFINSGGSAAGVTVSSGGTEQVSAGGSASGTVVLLGGAEQVYGADSAAQISGTLEVLSGGSEIGATLYAGSLIVHAGGAADDTVISGGTVELEVGVNGSGAIIFATSGGTLQIDGMTMPSGTISGLQTGNQIDLADVTFASGAFAEIVSGAVLRITDGTHQYDLNLAPDADYSGMTFDVVSAGTGLEVDVTCFAPGTHIRTPIGEALVEALKPDDLVFVADGRALPVRWLGRQTVSTRFGNPTRVLPIRIRAGALAENVPCRDLLVSSDHALLVEDTLVQAGALVNNISIVRENLVPERFTYLHIELDEHALVLAENTPAETFVDNVDRLRFDNWDEHQTIFPDGKAIAEMPYPRAKSHRQVPQRIRARLAARGAALYGSPVRRGA